MQHKQLLAELAKYEHHIQKLQTSGGFAACQIEFDTKAEIFEASHQPIRPQRQQNINGNSFSADFRTLPKPSTPPLPHLAPGALSLVKFLSLVENDPLDHVSNRVGDLATA